MPQRYKKPFAALHYLAFLTPFFLSIFSASAAHADITCTLCDVLYLVQADLGPGIATIGVIGVGIAATFGKVSWGMAVATAVGIAILFGAVEITATILDAGSPCLAC